MNRNVTRRRWFSDRGLTRKAYLNSVTALLDYGTRFVVAFLITPTLVVGLGDAVYGIWQVLGRLTGYLTAASGRPTETLRMSLASAQYDGDIDAKRRYVGSAILVWLLFLPIFVALGVIFIWFAPQWLAVTDAQQVILVRVATGVLVVKMALLSLTAIPQAVLQGENLGYKRMGLTAAVTGLGGGLTVLAVVLDFGLIGVASATLITAILTGLLYLQVVRQQVHWFGAARPSRPALWRFLGLSGWFLLWRIVLQLMQASDIVLLGIFGSVELVTVYALTKNIPEMMVTLVANVVSGMAPGLGGIVGSADYQKSAELRGEIMLYTWFIATVVGAGVILWNQAFVGLWVGAEYFAGDSQNLLIIVLMSQFAFIRNDASIIDLTLDIRQKVLVGALSLAVAGGLAIWLMEVYALGITGLLIGFIFGRTILTLTYPLIVGRLLHIPVTKQVRASVRPLLTTVSLFAAVLLWVRRPVVAGWGSLILFGVLSTIAVVALVYFAGLTRRQRRHLLMRTQRMVGRG